MNKILERIEKNVFLAMSSRVIGTLDPIYVFLSLTILTLTLVTGGKPWTNPYLIAFLPIGVPVICALCVFVLALSVGKVKAHDDIAPHSLLIASATVVCLLPIITVYTTAPFSLFIGFWVAFIFKFAYVFLKDIKLKLKGCPPAVLNTLSNLIPVFGSVLLTVGMSLLLYVYGSKCVEGVNVLFKIIGSYPVILLAVLAICLIWTSGFHGANIVNRIMRPFWVTMALVNLVTFTYSGKPAYIGSEVLINTFIWIGGSGGTLGLAIALRLFSKSQYMRQIAKEALIPGFFNINEPIIFGVPIVENKRYYIPFFLAPVLMVTIAYWSIHFGYITFPAYSITWIMPSPLAALIGSFFDWKAGLLALGLIVLSGIVYLPFVMMHDKELLEKERVIN